MTAWCARWGLAIVGLFYVFASFVLILAIIQLATGSTGKGATFLVESVADFLAAWVVSRTTRSMRQMRGWPSC